MDREILKKKTYKDLRLFISKTNIVGYTRLSKNELIDLILLQHPYRFTECMTAVQPNYVYDLIINGKYEDPADEFKSPVIKPKKEPIQNGEIENKKICPLDKLKPKPLTEKEIIEKEKLKQGILTFN
tara:strand:+ start:668 stop:1048 length:381 start_codon:yes stop_codon:yes gene_type:complete